MDALKIYLMLNDKIKVAVAYGFYPTTICRYRIRVKRKINKNRLIHCTIKETCGSGITMVTVYLFIYHHGHKTCFTKLTQAMTKRTFQDVKTINDTPISHAAPRLLLRALPNFNKKWIWIYQIIEKNIYVKIYNFILQVFKF